jgi:hypothetical protein
MGARGWRQQLRHGHVRPLGRRRARSVWLGTTSSRLFLHGGVAGRSLGVSEGGRVAHGEFFMPGAEIDQRIYDWQSGASGLRLADRHGTRSFRVRRLQGFCFAQSDTGAMRGVWCGLEVCTGWWRGGCATPCGPWLLRCRKAGVSVKHLMLRRGQWMSEPGGRWRAAFWGCVGWVGTACSSRALCESV